MNSEKKKLKKYSKAWWKWYRAKQRRQRIGSLLFERTALSKKPEATVAAELAKLRGGQMTPDMVFRDPYLLDFLGLSGAYSEKDLEVLCRKCA